MSKTTLRARTDFAAFSAATADQFPAYHRLMRGKTAHLEINATERFTRTWISKNFDRRGAFWAGHAERIVAEVDDSQRRLNGFGLVVTSMLALHAENFDAAKRLAERAYSMDQHEVFAQRLFLAAAEKSRSLRLEVDNWLKDRFCSNPFTDTEIIGSHDVYTCCAAWLPASIGSADTDAAANYWHGERATEIRRSILDGDFGYCSRLNCPRISGRNLPKRSDVVDPALRRAIDTRGSAQTEHPKRVLFSYDTSCNLSCPSCRSNLITLGQSEAQTLDAFYDRNIVPLVADATHIKITGSGDPFGSRHFRSVLKKLTADGSSFPRLQLQTNGVLFDERAWNELNLEGHVRSVWVSVDATDAETYSVLRRGGNFARLLDNLKFLGRLRAECRIGSLRLDFVVQNENFAQMPDFVNLANDVGADGVHFLMLRNWGTFSPDEFRDKAVTFDTHPNHSELLNVLTHTRLTQKGVDLGNLAPLRQIALERQNNQTTFCPPSITEKTSASDVKVIAVLATQRTGTNYLFQGLRSYADILVMAEIYNSNGAFGFDRYDALALKHFNKVNNCNFESESDLRLLKMIAERPLETLDMLRDVAVMDGRTMLAFKVFPGQVPQELLTRKILKSNNFKPVFVLRPLLHTYISYKKAQTTNEWRNRDTTGIKISLDPAQYREWMTNIQAWYTYVSNEIKTLGLKPVCMHYEDFTAVEKNHLSNFISEKLGPAGIELRAPSVGVIELRRQDRNPDVFGRILDGDNFRSKLQDMDLLDASLAPPKISI